MDFNGLNEWKPLVKPKVKTEATRLFLEEDKKINKLIPSNALGQCAIKRAGEQDETHSFT